MIGMVTAPSPAPRTTNANAEQKLAGMQTGLGVGKRADHHEQQSHQHHRTGADAVCELARLAAREQHAEALWRQE